jgi:hypothetical protein
VDGPWTSETNIPVSDSGSGSETISISVSFTLTDSGSGSENVSIERPLTVSDTGSGTETLAVQIGKSVADSGSGSEAIDISTESGQVMLDRGSIDVIPAGKPLFRTFPTPMEVGIPARVTLTKLEDLPVLGSLTVESTEQVESLEYREEARDLDGSVFFYESVSCQLDGSCYIILLAEEIELKAHGLEIRVTFSSEEINVGTKILSG